MTVTFHIRNTANQRRQVLNHPHPLNAAAAADDDDDADKPDEGSVGLSAAWNVAAAAAVRCRRRHVIVSLSSSVWK